ncbi:MAG: glycosyltransferase family 39 protein [Candidatus Latescibacterota bacterium]|nr:glycosyltransferase family 39 protein [Candidatus Latescibacterota bacterium]
MSSHWRLALLSVLLLATGLRLVGWQRGDTDFLKPEQARSGLQRAFHSFHPDENTLIRAGAQMSSPLDPPLTAYGLLPIYLSRMATDLGGWLTGVSSYTGSLESHRQDVFSVRLLSVAVSIAALLALYTIGRRHFGAPSGVLATALAAAPPLFLQTAHFYTVDGVFALLCLATIGSVLRVDERSGPLCYTLTGVLVGLTAAVRLNGLSLGILLVATHLCRRTPNSRAFGRALLQPSLWLAGAATVVTLLALMPYVAVSPELLWQENNTNDFSYSVGVADGRILRPWSLADTHTPPYLHYLTNLLPLSVGWPLAIAFIVALPSAVATGGRSRWLLLAATALLFVPVGALHTKHVRYLLPVLAPLTLLTADMFVRLQTGQVAIRRLTARVLLIGVLSATLVEGIAFAHIYTVEDARLQAARWIQGEVPWGTPIGVETGGFSMRGQVSEEVYPVRTLNTSSIFSTRGHLTCQSVASYMGARLQSAQYVALLDVNRYQQYVGAPVIYPGLARFYRDFIAGELGFSLVRTYKRNPQLLGLKMSDDGAEASFLGYDHPRVRIMAKDPGFEARFVAWEGALPSHEHCGDEVVFDLVHHIKSGSYEEGLRLALQNSARHPQSLITFITAHLYGLLGETELQQQFLDRWADTYTDKSLSAFLLPWANSSSLVLAGLPELGVQALRFGWRKRGAFSDDKANMAASYRHVSELLLSVEEGTLAEEATLMALDINPSVEGYNRAAEMLLSRGEYGHAVALWERSLQDQEQIGVRWQLGRTAEERGDWERAVRHLLHAVFLDDQISSDRRTLELDRLTRIAEHNGLADLARKVRAQHESRQAPL